jgi:acyl-CoA thioester hydrolase
MNNKFEWDFPTPHTIDITVSEPDLDEFDHVNNARYVQWCEKCAWSHSNSLGLDLQTYQDLDRAMVVKTAHIDYLAAATSGQSLRLATWVVHNDNKLCLERAYQLIRQNDHKTLLRGRTLFACVALSSGKPRRMPKLFIEGYGGVCIGAPQHFV